MCKVCGKIGNNLCDMEKERMRNWLKCTAREKYTGVIFGWKGSLDVQIIDNRWQDGKARLCMIVFECNEEKANDDFGALGFLYDIDGNGKFKIIAKMTKDDITTWY